MQSVKPRLLLVDRFASHREQVAARLAPLFDSRDYASMPEALRHARLSPPSAMLISDECIHDDQFAALKSIRLEPAFSTLPIIVTLSDAKQPMAVEHIAEQTAIALAAGATACLAKPYKPSTLIQVISSGINQSVEKGWEALPRNEAAALQASVAIFATVSNQIAEGKSITYFEIENACQPLLAATRTREIENVLRGVRQHDNYTYAHSLRVAVFLAQFGSGIGLAAEDLNLLTIGGLLHDLGKVDIPALVLNKAGKLNAAEFDIMKGHVPATMKILEQCEGIPKAALIIAGQHHEKLDGTGYPNGLSGAKLNQLARMAAIADVFSALTERRVYKAAIAPERALNIMAEEMDRHLDLRLLARFREMLLDTGLG